MPMQGEATLQEYLISLGVQMDTGAMAQMMRFLNSSTLKAAAMGTAFVAAGKALYGFIKAGVQTEQELEQLARKQHKTVETVRAQQNALKAMGKTMQEVSRDPALKSIYNDLVKTGKAMAMPDMKAGLSLVRQLSASFYELRYVVRYATQWINYHILANLKEPIQRITRLFRTISDFLRKNMNSVSMRIASYLTAFTKGLLGIAELGVKIVDWIHKLPDGIKSAGAAITAVFTLLKSGPLGQIMTAVTLIGGLIDDYENFRWNKANPDKEQVAVAFPSIWKLMDADDKTIGEKVSGIIGLIADSVNSEGATLGAIGGTIIGLIFGGDAKAKLLIFLATTIAGALLSSEVTDALKSWGTTIWQGIVDKMPNSLRELLGLEDTTHIEAQATVGKPVHFDENGRVVSAYEYEHASPEQKALWEAHTPTEREKAFAEAYQYAQGIGGVDLYQAPGDLYPSLAAPVKGMNDANTPVMAEWNHLWQTAIETQNAYLVRELASSGGQWQSYVASSKDAVTTQMVTDELVKRLETLKLSADSGLPLPSFKDVQDTFYKGGKTALSADVSADGNAGKGILADVQKQLDAAGPATMDVVLQSADGTIIPRLGTKKNAWGGRYNQPTTTEVAEDGGTEYIIPMNKPARAFALIKQMLGEMGAAATQRIMSDFGLGVSGTNGASAASISSMVSGATITNNYNISAPVTIQVTSSGADAKEVGTIAYSAAERQLIRSLKGVLA